MTFYTRQEAATIREAFAALEYSCQRASAAAFATFQRAEKAARADFGDLNIGRNAVLSAFACGLDFVDHPAGGLVDYDLSWQQGLILGAAFTSSGWTLHHDLAAKLKAAAEAKQAARARKRAALDY